MESAAMRQKLHDYIDAADERKLEAIYIILETDIQYDPAYSDATITMLHAGRDNHLNGSSKSYTIAETLAFARSQRTD